MTPALCVTGARLDGETVSLRAEDGLIAAIGPDVEAEGGDETLDADGAILSPPLVNNADDPRTGEGRNSPRRSDRGIRGGSRHHRHPRCI